MATVRQWHFYIGMLIAPSVLFFALTGAVQLFSLHEAHGSYTPPPIVEKLSSVHKDQVFAEGHHHDGGPPPSAKPEDAKTDTAKAGAAPAHDNDDDKAPVGTLLLKWFFLVVALGLTASTALGLWIGVTHPRYRRTAWILVAAGAVIPILLLVI